MKPDILPDTGNKKLTDIRHNPRINQYENQKPKNFENINSNQRKIGVYLVFAWCNESGVVRSSHEFSLRGAALHLQGLRELL